MNEETKRTESCQKGSSLEKTICNAIYECEDFQEAMEVYGNIQKISEAAFIKKTRELAEG